MLLSRPTQSVYRIAPRPPSIPFLPAGMPRLATGGAAATPPGGRGRPLPPPHSASLFLILPIPLVLRRQSPGRLAVGGRHQALAAQHAQRRRVEAGALHDLIPRQPFEPFEARGAELAQTHRQALAAVVDVEEDIGADAVGAAVQRAGADLAIEARDVGAGRHQAVVEQGAVAVDVGVEAAGLLALVHHVEVALGQRREEAVHGGLGVALADQHGLDLVDLLGRLAGDQARQLDHARAEELVALPLLVAAAAHRDQAVGAEVERDAHAAGESEALAHRLLVVALQVDGADQQVERLAARVEGAVPQVLLELDAARAGQAVDPALEAEHGAEGLVLALAGGTLQV